ncbi:MAG: outer membrane beta-barrel protein, partial [Muribaculaceae bacterium]|nr:outer membrane beta-barrel protein [Muribaculaceae bacterium]
MRKLIVLMVFAFLGVATVRAVTLFGKVCEAGTGEALMQASVRVLAQKDSSLVKGAVTNDKGRFRIEGLKSGKYIVEASYVGFTTQTRDVSVGSEDVRLKPFELSESSIMLNEAVVRGIRTPIKVMEDTVEYSAESYKTQPNAVVEDLLKRLPGVEVGSDGKITANGKEVTKILVDGKEFFSDDPTVASRNLPVNMVEKLQVVDRKSDLARLTGVDDGEDETVINLTVKKDMKNGWFGNAEVGYGTDNRYRANFNVNRFWNGNQITFLGGANNVNEPGFADGASGRFRRFGGDNGITSSQAFGINFNVGKEEIFRVGGDVMYSHTDRDTRTSSDRQYLFTDSTSTTRSGKVSRDKGHNLRADFRMIWKPDSFNTLEFRPNISLNYNKSNSTDSSLTTAGGRAPHDVTKSYNSDTSHGNSFELGGRLIYNHNFRQRRGRSFSVMLNYRMSNVREYSDSYSLNRFLSLDSIDEYDEQAENHTWANNVSARLSWTEPLGNASKGNFLTFSYQISYRWNNADKITYDRVPVYQDGDAEGFPTGYELWFNPDLSNRFRNDYMSQDIRVGYQHVSKNSNLNAGISLVPQMSQSRDLINSERDIPRRNVLNFAPFLRYRYRLSKSRSLNLHYMGRSSQPTMAQLQPVADMSDPLRIVIGNPDLKPTFSHNVMLRFQDFNQKAQRSIMAMVDAQYQQNSIISQTTFDPTTGGQTTTYRNVNGVWNIRGMNMVSFPFRNKAFTFNNHIFLNYASTVGFNNAERNRSGSFSLRESPGIAWRPDNLELELRPTYSLQTTTNSVQKGANRTVHTYGGSFYGTYTTPIGIVLSTDLNYSATSGYSAGYDTRTWLWNASLSYEFLRGRNAAVSLKAYDLLGQKSNVLRSVTANYIDDTRYNSLTRYVMVSISYRFNTFGKGNEPVDRNERRFPGPPPGGGPGPGGP